MARSKSHARHVGSLIRPDRLLDARAKFDAGELDPVSLRAVENECIRDVVRLQEETGLDQVTDGEFRRLSWSHDFLYRIENVVPAEGRLNVFFRNADGSSNGVKPLGIGIAGKLGRPRPIQRDDFLFLKGATRVEPKVCIPSPTMLHFRNGRHDIDARAYPRIKEFFADVARIYRDEIADLVAHGLKHLQIDDPNFGLACDPRFHAALVEIGEEPEELFRTYVEWINGCLESVPAGVDVSVHLCRGNGAAMGAASGGYDAVAEVLFGGLKVHGFYLEYDDDRSGGFAPLRYLTDGKYAVLGLVTTKSPILEDKDVLRARIDEAAKVVPLDRLALSPQCGFASGVRQGRKRALEEEDERAKLRRVVETAAEVWG